MGGQSIVGPFLRHYSSYLMSSQLSSLFVQIIMYNTLENENAKFRETIVELSKMCASNLQMEQTVKELEGSNKRLMDRIEVADLQVQSLKHT